MKREKSWYEKTKIANARDFFSAKVERKSWGSLKRIAIVHIDGTITGGKNSGGGLFSSQSTGSETISNVLERLREDDAVAGVIIRVDSPGGSGLASDIIWNGIRRLRAKNKKVYISFADVAASGGYYVACGGEKIFSNEGTLTGSIGVFGGKFTLKGLYEKIGINKTIIRQSPNAAIFTEAEKFSDDERKLMTAHLEEFYQIFLTRVGEAREMKKETVHESARGRVWTGKQAHERKLVDHMGGLLVALEMMKTALKDREYEITQYPADQGLFSMANTEAVMKVLGLEGLVSRAAKNAMQNQKFRDSEVLMMMPAQIEVK
ncbi:MAG: signal peptide peptidase SppA [Leptospiraceae bacterium]|nr:signal peptide peptidase SppA [Leptospiraceae bacterium]